MTITPNTPNLDHLMRVLDDLDGLEKREPIFYNESTGHLQTFHSKALFASSRKSSEDFYTEEAMKKIETLFNESLKEIQRHRGAVKKQIEECKTKLKALGNYPEISEKTEKFIKDVDVLQTPPPLPKKFEPEMPTKSAPSSDFEYKLGPSQPKPQPPPKRDQKAQPSVPSDQTIPPKQNVSEKDS